MFGQMLRHLYRQSGLADAAQPHQREQSAARVEQILADVGNLLLASNKRRKVRGKIADKLAWFAPIGPRQQGERVLCSALPCQRIVARNVRHKGVLCPQLACPLARLMGCGRMGNDQMEQFGGLGLLVDVTQQFGCANQTL